VVKVIKPNAVTLTQCLHFRTCCTTGWMNYTNESSQDVYGVIASQQAGCMESRQRGAWIFKYSNEYSKRFDQPVVQPAVQVPTFYSWFYMVSINHITGGGGLGSESAGTMRYSSGSFMDFSQLPITETTRMAQHCGRTTAVAVVHKPRPPVNITWPDICCPDTWPFPPKQPSHTSVTGLPQARVS